MWLRYQAQNGQSALINMDRFTYISIVTVGAAASAQIVARPDTNFTASEQTVLATLPSAQEAQEKLENILYALLNDAAAFDLLAPPVVWSIS